MDICTKPTIICYNNTQASAFRIDSGQLKMILYIYYIRLVMALAMSKPSHNKYLHICLYLYILHCMRSYGINACRIRT